MRRNIFEYQNKKKFNLYGEADATKSERIIMTISLWVGFVACIVTGYLYSKDIIPLYWFFVSFAIPFVPFLIFFINHFFIKKDAKIHKESYNLKGSYNNITKKDNMKVTNYKYEDLNNKDKGD